MDKKALIGFSGFVGGNLAEQGDFSRLYNSKNISEIAQDNFNLVVCAAPTAVKWKANQFPEEDLTIINKLIGDLENVKTKTFVHISTVDVYKVPQNVNEDSEIVEADLHPYGKHRFMLEEFIRNKFKHHLIIRLPGLFGTGLKKNFIFDLMNHNALDFTHKDSEFQYYYLKNLWRDINTVLKNEVKLINFNSEPIPCSELAQKVFNIKFTNTTDNPAVKYNIKSKYASLFGGQDGYQTTKEQIFLQLKEFTKKGRSK